MSPSRKSRSVNRRTPYANEIPLKRVQRDATTTPQRKRKLSDMLGPKWSKEELERFYEAYRKHGKDWKKVAAAVRYRSADMVEALFSFNKAYLSLPEGIASVVGLVAMMTDHYAIMGKSDSEQDSSGRAGASRKPRKRARAKLLPNSTKKIERKLPDPPKLISDVPDYGCLSLLKKKHSGGKTRAVGRRTPRVPVSYTYDIGFGTKIFLQNKQGFKQNMNDNDDHDITCEVAAALTKASQRGGQRNFSRTTKSKPAITDESPIRNGIRMHAGSGSPNSKPHDNDFEEGGCELSLGSTEGTGIGVHRKGRILEKKIFEVNESTQYDDVKEACSGTEEREEVTVFKKKLERKSLRKKRKKILFGEDRDSTFDALQTLADLSLMMPASTADTDRTVQIKEEKESFDTVKPSKRKGNRLASTEVGIVGTSEASKVVGCEINAAGELKEKVFCSKVTQKRKQRSSPFRIPKADASLDPRGTDSWKVEASDRKGKCFSQRTPRTKRVKMPPECTASNTDLKTEAKLQLTNFMNFNKGMSWSNQRVQDSQSDHKFLGSVIEEDAKLPVSEFHGAALNPKDKLQHFLSKSQARKWCIFEWFYSAIDYPWFARREFTEYLDHVGLGHVPCLTRVEWGVIRSSLGKPRRFSKQFLKEEREKLHKHRESVRKHHSTFRSGTLEVLPYDLPRPLSERQRVVVIHPKSREIHGGYVLTVDHSSSLIQFEQLELGIHWVKDIDCMPLNPLDNIPESQVRSTRTSKKSNENSNGLRLSGQMKDSKMNQQLELPTAKKQHNTGVPSHLFPSAIHIMKTSNLPEGGSSNCSSQSTAGLFHNESATFQRARNSQTSVCEQIQARDTDVLALSELTRALDKKEVVISELRYMNDEVSEIQKDGVNSLKESHSFKKHYAATLLQLNDVNQQVSSALCRLRQRNSYQESIHQNSGTKSIHPTACKSAEIGPGVARVIDSSRIKARAMVAAAIKATSSLLEEVKNLDEFEEAIDFVNDQLSAQDSLLSADTVTVKLEPQDQGTTTSYSPSPASSHRSELDSIDPLDEDPQKLPIELISNSVATLLMIQNCTERQIPPAEVAQIIDSAIRSLRPICSQNLPIFTEIQNCMGMIRNQILGLVPTT